MKRLFLACALVCPFLAFAGSLRAADPGVRLTALEDRVRVEIDGALFTEYRWGGLYRPVFHPVLMPDGAAVTRYWPMREDGPKEDRDHSHHRGLWFAHGNINGLDFWSERKADGRTVLAYRPDLESGPSRGHFSTREDLATADGQLIGRSERTVRIERRRDLRQLDFEISLIASEGDLVIGDTKEGTMAIRVRRSMQVKPHTAQTRDLPAEGTVVNCNGDTNDDAWGKRAAWAATYGPVDGRMRGVALLDHPHNLRHPTWWHARTYGLFAANPFGVHYFEKLPDKEAGNYTVPKGGRLTLRYRWLFFDGTPESVGLDREFRDWAAE